MKIKSLLLSICLMGLLIVCSNNSVFAQEQESSATLEETLNWMASKLEKNYAVTKFVHKQYFTETDFLLSRKLYAVKYEDVKVNGCKITWKTTTEQVQLEILEGWLGKQKEPWINKNSEEVSLEKYDRLEFEVKKWQQQTDSRSSIVTEEPIYAVYFTNRNSKVYAPPIFFQTEQIAKRFLKASEHANKLCGGKVEPF